MQRTRSKFKVQGSRFGASVCTPQPGAWSGLRQGQSMVEYAVLVAAVATALLVMSDYIRKAFNAHAEAIEEELNGATEDNDPAED